MKKIYLDVCTLCRPYDDQSLLRIRLETDSFFLILKAVTDEKYQMITSPIHFREIADINEQSEKLQLINLLENFGSVIKYDLLFAKMRSKELINKGLGVADAIHIAFAEQAADSFITCDDKLLKKSTKIKLNTNVLNPVQFCLNEGLII